MEIQFKNYIEQKLREILSGNTNIDLSKITVNDEYSFNQSLDINVTVKKLSGTTTSYLSEVPYQIMATVRKDLYKEIKHLFDYFAESYNEKTITMKDEDGNDVAVLTFFSPHFVLNQDVDLGLTRGVTLTINAKIIFSQAQDLLKINTLMLDSQAFIVLESNIAPGITTNTTGALMSGGQPKSLNQSSVTTHQFMLVAYNNGVCQKIIRYIVNGVGNESYRLQYKIGTTTCDKTCILTNPTSYSDKVNGYPIIVATFVEKNS